jgi:hypothetical protein
MDETAARAMIKDHFDASTITVAGGGPRDDIARASARRHSTLPGSRWGLLLPGPLFGEVVRPSRTGALVELGPLGGLGDFNAD